MNKRQRLTMYVSLLLAPSIAPASVDEIRQVHREITTEFAWRSVDTSATAEMAAIQKAKHIVLSEDVQRVVQRTQVTMTDQEKILPSIKYVNYGHIISHQLLSSKVAACRETNDETCTHVKVRFAVIGIEGLEEE